ncbi:MAG: hypothetical protein ACK462_11950 [Planctomyces sp.]
MDGQSGSAGSPAFAGQGVLIIGGAGGLGANVAERLVAVSSSSHGRSSTTPPRYMTSTRSRRAYPPIPP